MEQMDKRETIFFNSVFFVLGFTIVFSVVGIALQTFLSRISFSTMNLLRIIGGVVITFFGIVLAASAKYAIPFFSIEHKFRFAGVQSSYLSSLLFGVGFALGWTPCVGPILGAVYALAATSPAVGFLLLLFYSIGLGIPFIIAGAFISRLYDFRKRISGFLTYFSVISGIFLVVMGILVITGYIGLLAIFLNGAQAPMANGNQLNLLIALIAGVLTFLSPCILPLLPAFLAYMGGTTVREVKK